MSDWLRLTDAICKSGGSRMKLHTAKDSEEKTLYVGVQSGNAQGFAAISCDVRALTRMAEGLLRTLMHRRK